MKTLEEILKQEPVYLNEWKSKVDVISDFDEVYITTDEYNADKAPYPNPDFWNRNKEKMTSLLEQWKPINILFASYGSGNYEGDAFVLFERDGKLYEVNGSHCSCHGLEGGFAEEETTIEAIAHRLIKGKLGRDSGCDNDFAIELKQFLGITN